LDIRRIATIKEGGESMGNRTKVKVVKNKMAPPFREAEFDIMYSEGISKEGDILDKAVDFRIIDKSGTWFSYNEIRLGQGRENVKRFLQENKDMLDEITKKVRIKLGLDKDPEASEEKIPEK
jgi:recombination protein RecA